jgi:hypothetical protein
MESKDIKDFKKFVKKQLNFMVKLNRDIVGRQCFITGGEIKNQIVGMCYSENFLDSDNDYPIGFITTESIINIIFFESCFKDTIYKIFNGEYEENDITFFMYDPITGEKINWDAIIKEILKTCEFFDEYQIRKYFNDNRR